MAFTDNLVDKVFSMKKEHYILVGIIALGFVLRLIAAINLGVSADDMHHVTDAINFYSAGRLENFGQSAGLWHAFTSIVYKAMGTTQIASRFAAMLFGTLTIFSIFLFTKEFFGKKIALIASFLLAVAPFHIKNTTAEMDVMTMFFVIMGMYLFIKARKNSSKMLFAFAGIYIGLAIYTKVYPLLFIPSMLIYFVFLENKAGSKIFSKKNFYFIAIFLAAIFVFAIPALTHNYLLYKDKGFMDLQFTRTLGLGKNVSAQYYSLDTQFEAKNSWSGLIFGDKKHIASGTPLLIGAVNFIRIGDPIAFYLGAFGILLVLFYKKEFKSYIYFILISIAFVLPFLASIILMPKHYLFLEILLMPLAAFSVEEINNSLLKKFKRSFLIYFLAGIFLIVLVFLGIPNSADITHFYGKSSVARVMDFKESSINQNYLIIADSRIYRGRINWMLQGRPYLEARDFVKLININSSENTPVQVYYLECIPDDCGWGTIKNDPDFNASMEYFTNQFKSRASLVKSISAPDENKAFYPFMPNRELKEINIYSSVLNVNEYVLNAASYPKVWFLYDIGYMPKQDQFDYYDTKNILDSLLDDVSHKIVTLSLILTVLSCLYAIYLSFKEP